MRRVFKYTHFTGMSPICRGRITEYPELAYVRDLTPEQLRTADRGDLEDAQHQWVISYGARGRTSIPMQQCYDCPAVRPAPLEDYPEHDRMFILQEFMRRNLPALKEISA